MLQYLSYANTCFLFVTIPLENCISQHRKSVYESVSKCAHKSGIWQNCLVLVIDYQTAVDCHYKQDQEMVRVTFSSCSTAA